MVQLQIVLLFQVTMLQHVQYMYMYMYMYVPAGVVVAKLVSFTREIQPLWVTKLVPNEGEVGFPTQPEGS